MIRVFPKRKDLLLILVTTLVFLNAIGILIVPPVHSSTQTRIYIDPEEYQAQKIDDIITVNVKIENVDLFSEIIGIEFKLEYDQTILEFVNITEGEFMKESGDTYFMWANDVSPQTHLVVGDLLLPRDDGTWLLFPQGGGTLAVINLRAKYRSVEPESPASCDLRLYDTIIVNVDIDEIAHIVSNGYYEILSMPLPELDVVPERNVATQEGETFSVNININDLDSDLQLIGVEFKLRYDTTLLETRPEWVTEGDFLKNFAQLSGTNTWFQAYVENDYGLIGILILPDETGVHVGPFPEGSGSLVTITFNVTHVPWEPKSSYVLQLSDTILIDVNTNTINHIVSHGYYEFSSYLSLVPDTGYAATTIIGGRFAANSPITVTWDGTVMPTVPSLLITDANGNFTAMISVPTQTILGEHVISVKDGEGNSAESTFTVIDMTGPQGEKGEPAPTEIVWVSIMVWTSIIIAVIAILLTVYSLVAKKF